MTSPSSPVRILIMEDDAGIARLIQKRLQGAGFEALIARDGKEGLNMYEAGTYDLVAVDHAMPELNGLEVMSALKKRGPLPPTIMVTGKGSESVAVEAMKLGASDYIVKDVDGGFLDLLPGVIGQVLERLDLIEKGRKAEEALRKSEAEQLIKNHKLKAMGTFAGGIAHDFNNLLAVILGNIELSKACAEEGSELESFLLEAQKASLQAKNLSQRFLTFADGGKPVTKPGSIASLIQEATNLSLSGSNVMARFSHPKDLFLADLDEGQIKQVINNLVTNAWEAMPLGGTIHVNAENLILKAGDVTGLGEGEYIKVSVVDEGLGIAEEILSKVFDPYFSTKEMGSEKGLGLGLTVCQSIITKHKGYLAVRSDKGVGTTFYFYLPASAKKAVMEKQPERAPAPKRPRLRKGRILVMDDEEMLRNLSEKILQGHGYEVTLTEDGREAIEAYIHQKDLGRPFDAVLLDLTIKGGMGGREVIKELLLIDPQVKAIILSGYFNDPVIADFKDYGFCGAITKPFQIRDLIETLSTVLDQSV